MVHAYNKDDTVKIAKKKKNGDAAHYVRNQLTRK
jgi:hypothetical protein